jgi:hypothetical protein
MKQFYELISLMLSRVIDQDLSWDYMSKVSSLGFALALKTINFSSFFGLSSASLPMF